MEARPRARRTTARCCWSRRTTVACASRSGYGLEGALTDATSKRIIAETITPLFRQGDFYGGINAGLDQMMRVIDGEPLPEPDRAWSGAAPGLAGLLPFLFIGVVVASSILNAIFGRGLGALVTGGIAGGVVWLIAKVLGIAILAGLAAAVFSLFAGVSRRGWSSAGATRRLGQGSAAAASVEAGGGGGGFGGGGFSGGGGSFGGGGASGSW